jgi:hypothetical protein
MAPEAAAWFARNSAARVLSAFDHACNLMDEQHEVVALVSPELGNGPFHAVLNAHISFRSMRPASEIHLSNGLLTADHVQVDLRMAQLWSPFPDWCTLRASLELIARRAQQVRSWLQHDLVAPSALRAVSGPNGGDANFVPGTRLPKALSTALLCESVAKADLQGCGCRASELAGAGPGSTPSGDDFILGAIYAAWIVHPESTARAVASAMIGAALPRTTSLSSAWLIAAGEGGAGAVWHDLFSALLGADNAALLAAVAHILHTGASSGAEALAGFLGVLNAYTIPEPELCPSLTH